jgi:hypothetical protein
MGKVANNNNQDLSLQIPGCVHHSVVLHELLHALGFVHEHTRPDRDTYVRVYYENIEASKIRKMIYEISYKYDPLIGQKFAFDKFPSSQINTFNEAYDYGKNAILCIFLVMNICISFKAQSCIIEMMHFQLMVVRRSSLVFLATKIGNLTWVVVIK